MTKEKLIQFSERWITSVQFRSFLKLRIIKKLCRPDQLFKHCSLHVEHRARMQLVHIFQFLIRPDRVRTYSLPYSERTLYHTVTNVAEELSQSYYMLKTMEKMTFVLHTHKNIVLTFTTSFITWILMIRGHVNWK